MVEGKKFGLAGRCFLAGLSVVGLLKVAGCEGTSEGDMANAAVQGIAMKTGTPKAYQAAGILGGLAQKSADYQRNMDIAKAGRTEVNFNPGQPSYSNDESWRYNPELSKMIDEMIKNNHRWETDPAVSAAIEKTIEDAKNGVRPVGPFENFVRTHPEYANIPWIKEYLEKEKNEIDEQMKKNEPIRRRN